MQNETLETVPSVNIQAPRVALDGVCWLISNHLSAGTGLMSALEPEASAPKASALLGAEPAASTDAAPPSSASPSRGSAAGASSPVNNRKHTSVGVRGRILLSQTRTENGRSDHHCIPHAEACRTGWSLRKTGKEDLSANHLLLLERLCQLLREAAAAMYVRLHEENARFLHWANAVMRPPRAPASAGRRPTP